ncbi:MAG: ATP-grasp domain-containing protein [Bacteroidota bacterium]
MPVKTQNNVSVMIIPELPYISKFLENTLKESRIPVLKNEASRKLQLSEELNYYEQADFTNLVKKTNDPLIYSNSENSINWINQNLSFTRLPEYIRNFKDKAYFRSLIKKMYPDFFFRTVSLNELEHLDINTLPMPFIIKPSIGFFSIGVHRVNNIQEWQIVVQKIKKEILVFKDCYPGEVVDTSLFLIEEVIPGDEFAVDVYYDKEGNPVILNILKHLFASEEDMSDRIYITSKKIIQQYHDNFLDFLSQLGDIADLKGFAMHVELRMNNRGKIIPVEVNPMRFGGWCVADIAWYAYGINVYKYFFEQKKPDWESILKQKNDEIYSLCVADLPKDIDRNDIIEIDYENFTRHFEKVLQLRETDYRQYGVFAFLFAQTSPGNQETLQYILKSDLKEFIRMKQT